MPVNFPYEIDRYLNGSPEVRRWRLVATSTEGIDRVVVIPALAENELLFDTLLSLSRNAGEELKSTLVICVVNNRAPSHSPAWVVEENRSTIECLRQILGLERHGPAADLPQADVIKELRRSGIRIAYVDASSPGLELPPGSGAGTARKIGMDIALTVFDYSSPRKKLIISLDADTLVEPNYLGEIGRYFEESGAESAAVSFRHRLEGGERQMKALCEYETFLRYYVAGLRYARSPYAYHAIGSAMACTAGAYAAVAGMSRRPAAEDFYFLQKLAKYRGVGEIRETTVYPSGRISERVPFGTGKKLAQLMERPAAELYFYNPEVFEILGKFLSAIEDCCREKKKPGFAEMSAICSDIDPALTEFLEICGFERVWERLNRNSSCGEVLAKHFHCWFDAFRTLKLVHHLRGSGYGSVHPFTAVRVLMEMSGVSGDIPEAVGPDDPEWRIKLLESMRNNF